MNVKKSKAEEIKYGYKNSSQINCQTGFIGHLRGDFGSNGNEFWTTWFPCIKKLPEDFSGDLDRVANYLRYDMNLLKNFEDMKNQCEKGEYICKFNEEDFFCTVETDVYIYIVHFICRTGDYNFYIYCYRKESFKCHLKNAYKGIRFIDSRYNELFRINDGEKVVLTLADGTEENKVVRYIDDYHIEIDYTIYHICEYAEKREKAGITIAPKK